MLLRRIREHVGTHNWFAVGIDLTIVALGVFLGMQVTNWNEARLAREAGESYRARIVRDLDHNVHDLQARAAYYTQLKGFGLQVLGNLDGATPMSDERFLIAAYQLTHLDPRPVLRVSYDEILAVGVLETLGDEETREAIANYYANIEGGQGSLRNVAPYRDIMRRAMPFHIQERVRANCTEIATENGRYYRRLSLPETCSLGLSRSEIARAAAQVRATPGLASDLTRHMTEMQMKIIVSGRLEASARRLRAQLAAAR